MDVIRKYVGFTCLPNVALLTDRLFVPLSLDIHQHLTVIRDLMDQHSDL